MSNKIKEVRWRQCQLKQGNKTLRTWLSNEKSFKIGDRLELTGHLYSDGGDGLWDVISVGEWKSPKIIGPLGCGGALSNEAEYYCPFSNLGPER